ncbi:TonB-dependent receptor [Halioxenophilus aromaticivorans]|uniref:TonB-dependent receptor n=1 Tax=Halioxenophilus aromaticivorans TaxID=1306992 RepID=A0AAV3U5D4_9ALTE
MTLHRFLVNTSSLGLALTFANASLAATANNPHHPMEEVVVTGHTDKTLAETALPVSVLSAEQLAEQRATNLGDTLAAMPGVQSTSFGAGVGRPIIRGQSGNRVKVLSGSLSVLDASTVSPDHANAVSPLGAERIEVIRGPATLLYGNGASGGVVNVLDNRIPDAQLDDISLVINQEHNTNNDQNTTSALLETSTGPFQWHLNGYTFRHNKVTIPSEAMLEEELHDEDGDDHEEEEHTSTDGYIGNSQGEGDGITLGSSYVGDGWYAGFAVNHTRKDYGLPPGTHDHEEHEEDLIDGAAEEEHEEESVDVRIDMEQTRYEFKSGVDLNGFFSSLEASIAYTDYEHEELELGEHHEEEEADADHEEEEHHGTVYSNEGFDSRFTLNHNRIAGLTGVIGLQVQSREFGGAGEEAYIAPTDINSAAIFAVESVSAGDWTYEFGARLEANQTELSSGCDQDHTTFSGSASALRPLAGNSNGWIGYTYSQRAPSEEELFSNVDGSSCQNYAEDNLIEHIATGRIELGNPDLDAETSQNLELGWRKFEGTWLAEINLYYNQVSDYIYAAFTDDEEMVAYQQQDAKFYGVEGQYTHHLWRVGDSHLDLVLSGDWVKATLDDGDNVPRLAPARVGIALAWVAEQWSAQLSNMEVMKQTHTAEGETETDGYSLVNAYLDYHFNPDHSGLMLYARGKNLLDEDIRDHTSFIKNVAPAPGRGAEIGLSWSF